MRTFSELMKNPHSPLTKEEYENFDKIMFSGRTDGRPHEEFDYDPDTGEEVPPAHGKYEFLNALSRSEDESIRRRAIKARWWLFHRGFSKTIDEMIKNGELDL